MNEHVYKEIDLVGSSTSSVEDAVNRALEKAAQTVRNLRWFKVVDIRGTVENGEVQYWQVTLKVGFTLDE